MVQQTADTGVQKLRLPLYDRDQSYIATSTNDAWQDYGQQFLNCFPVVNKNPTAAEEGEVQLISRDGFMYPVTGGVNDFASGVTGIESTTYFTILAALALRGMPSDTIIIAAADFASPKMYMKIFQYRPGSGTTLLTNGRIDMSSYGYNIINWVVNLSQLTNGNGVPAIGVTFHPEIYPTSTGTNSDMYYAVASGSMGSWTFSGSSLTQITDVDCPVNLSPNPKGIVGPIVQLNNVHYIQTIDGFIYGTYPSTTYPFNPDISTWNAAGNTATLQSPDAGAGLVRYKHHLIAMGQNSMEFFNDEGIAQPSLPIRRTQQAFSKVGCLGPQAVINVDDDLYFFGISADTGHMGLYKMSGYTPELVSTPHFNQKILNRASYNVNLQAMSMKGMTHLITHIPSNPHYSWPTGDLVDPVSNQVDKGCLVYCIDTKAWWTLGLDYSYAAADMSVTLFITAKAQEGTNPYQYIWVGANDIVSGYNYGMHPCSIFSYAPISSYSQTDELRQGNSTGPAVVDSWTIPVAFSTNELDLGTYNRKTINRLRFIMQIPYEPLAAGNALYDAGSQVYYEVKKDKQASLPPGKGTAAIARSFNLQNVIENPTFNQNNIGTCRTMRLHVWCNTYRQLLFRAIEADIRVAAH